MNKSSLPLAPPSCWDHLQMEAHSPPAPGPASAHTPCKGRGRGGSFLSHPIRQLLPKWPPRPAHFPGSLGNRCLIWQGSQLKQPHHHHLTAGAQPGPPQPLPLTPLSPPWGSCPRLVTSSVTPSAGKELRPLQRQSNRVTKLPGEQRLSSPGPVCGFLATRVGPASTEEESLSQALGCPGHRSRGAGLSRRQRLSPDPRDRDGGG